MYIFKFIRFVYSNYRICKYQNKIKKYTKRVDKLQGILNLGFESEQDFYNTMRDKWNKVKPVEAVPRVNKESKKRLQKLAGIIQNDDLNKSEKKLKKEVAWGDVGASAVLSVMAEKE